MVRKKTCGILLKVLLKWSVKNKTTRYFELHYTYLLLNVLGSVCNNYDRCLRTRGCVHMCVHVHGSAPMCVHACVCVVYVRLPMTAQLANNLRTATHRCWSLPEHLRSLCDGHALGRVLFVTPRLRMQTVTDALLLQLLLISVGKRNGKEA
jgi:hypothetical protein